MKLLTRLVPALILATSSVALAKPVFDLDVGGELQFRGDHRMRRRPTWLPLSEMLTASRRNVIDVKENRDDLTALRLQNGYGATYVYSITLRYEDGSRERIEVGKWLYSRNPVLTFDLTQHRGGVDKISISTWSNMKSTFQVMGQQMRRFPRPLPPEPPIYQPPPLPQPVGLTIGTDLTFANTHGYIHIPLGSDKGSFSKIRIVSTGSGTFIGDVNVTFASGAHQTLSVNKAMVRGESLDLDLQGRAQALAGITLMQGHDVRAVGPAAGKFNVILL